MWGVPRSGAPGWQRKGVPKPEALILDFTGVSEADYAAVNKHLGINMQTGEGD